MCWLAVVRLWTAFKQSVYEKEKEAGGCRYLCVAHKVYGWSHAVKELTFRLVEE